MLGITKQQQTKKLSPLKEKPFKSKDYLSWLHNSDRKCLVCGDSTIELHHVDNGIGRRDDRTCVVLCPSCHRGTISPHGFDSNKFYEKYPKEFLLEIAQKLYEEYRSENA